MASRSSLERYSHGLCTPNGRVRIAPDSTLKRAATWRSQIRTNKKECAGPGGGLFDMVLGERRARHA